MGAQWKQKGREQSADAKGRLFTKLAKEIMIAAKSGADPNGNPRLRLAIDAARKASMTRDTLERAIKKGSGQLDEQVNYELVTYEGFAPHQVPVIVECLTENKNRSASDLRVIFRKGQLGSIGSVSWMFDRLGVVEATHPDASLDIEGVAIEAGAQNVEKLEVIPPGHSGARFLCDPKDLDTVSKFVAANGWEVSQSELSYIAKSFVELGEAERNQVIEFLGELDDHDDVHRVYAGLK